MQSCRALAALNDCDGWTCCVVDTGELEAIAKGGGEPERFQKGAKLGNRSRCGREQTVAENDCGRSKSGKLDEENTQRLRPGCQKLAMENTHFEAAREKVRDV